MRSRHAGNEQLRGLSKGLQCPHHLTFDGERFPTGREDTKEGASRDDLGDHGRHLVRQVFAVVHQDDRPVSAELTDERLQRALVTAGPDAERTGDASLDL